MTRILFLDFDGVVNDLAWIHSPERAALRKQLRSEGKDIQAADIVPVYAARIRRLVESVGQGLRIVVCSSWGQGHALEELLTMFEPYAIPLHDKIRCWDRPAAILDYVGSIPAEERVWCVLDDGVRACDIEGSDGLAVTPSNGVTDEEIDRAIEFLTR